MASDPIMSELLQLRAENARLHSVNERQRVLIELLYGRAGEICRAVEEHAANRFPGEVIGWEPVIEPQRRTPEPSE
jgi:hypothetical protein